MWYGDWHGSHRTAFLGEGSWDREQLLTPHPFIIILSRPRNDCKKPAGGLHRLLSLWWWEKALPWVTLVQDTTSLCSAMNYPFPSKCTLFSMWNTSHCRKKYLSVEKHLENTEGCRLLLISHIASVLRTTVILSSWPISISPCVFKNVITLYIYCKHFVYLIVLCESFYCHLHILEKTPSKWLHDIHPSHIT